MPFIFDFLRHLINYLFPDKRVTQSNRTQKVLDRAFYELSTGI